MRLLRRHPIWSLLLLLLAALMIWTLWGNRALVTTGYQVESQEIPRSFDSLKIAQISDLHNTRFGSNNQKLVAMLEEAQPDLIAITGDLIDSRRTDPDVAIAFAQKAVKIAPVYYIPGNHEARLPEDYTKLKAALTDLGVVVLENESVTLEKDGQEITFSGLMDPDFGIPWPEIDADSYQVVLSHRPELFDQYVSLGFDLVLTGHAHGGQFRLPFIGGLFAPHQGFFPKYDSGIHAKENTTMVVSRGLGNSLFPLRFNNRPEVVVITLESI